MVPFCYGTEKESNNEKNGGHYDMPLVWWKMSLGQKKSLNEKKMMNKKSQRVKNRKETNKARKAQMSLVENLD